MTAETGWGSITAAVTSNTITNGVQSVGNRLCVHDATTTTTADTAMIPA